MIPKLYNAREKQFLTLGIGMLADCQQCIVTEERNGVYALSMTYPISGVHYHEIQNDKIILAKANDKHQEQPFRIISIGRPMNGIVTVTAEHVCNDANSIIVEPLQAGSAPEAVSAMMTHSVGDNPFTFSTDKSTVATFKVETPENFRALMGGVQGSLLQTFGGGEYEFDRWNIFLRSTRGQDNGVVIEYGKNLTDLNQDENISNLVTAVYPFWNGEGDFLSLPEKIVEVQTTFSHKRIQKLDLTNDFKEKPSVEALRSAAQKYMVSTTLKTPRISIKASFVNLWQMEEYKDDPLYKQIAGLERVSLCDIVTIKFRDLNVDVTAKIIKTTYNVLLEKYDSVEIGESRTNLTSALVSQNEAIAESVQNSDLKKAIENATNLITGATGGHVVLDPPHQPQRMLIMDTENKATATKAWQWNLNGLGYSNTGINGEYNTGITMDGAIVADLITSGTLNANIIKAGILQDRKGLNKINLDTGDVDMNGTFKSSAKESTTIIGAGNLAMYIDGRKVFSVEAYPKRWDPELEDSAALTFLNTEGTNMGSLGAAWDLSTKKIIGLFIRAYHLTLNNSKGSTTGTFAVNSNDESFINVQNLNQRKLSWVYMMNKWVLCGE